MGIVALDGQARGTAQRAGQAIEETGRATQRAIEAATKFGTDLRRRRQQAEDDGFTSSVTTKARSRFQEVFLESQNQATEGAEDFASSFQKRLDRETEALIEAARTAGGRPSTRAIQDTRGRLQLLGAAFTGQAASFENNARIAKLSRDLTGGLEDLARQAFDDPERRPELLDAADEGIDAAASFLPTAELEALRERALSAITLASVNGVIERDPGLAVEMLEAGDFDEGLEAVRKAALIGGAKTAMRLEEEATTRELAADRRELTRDAEAAIAKLRGGQQVPEVAALESRAEALADSDTRAALRHAEDDRLFMRRFAQRPPAAQAELIAAMENGPELKPAETRRLAAMKAQAAVTERALARDPLAYAHGSGVIEEPADLTDLAPDVLRARLRQAEITQEQFGLATLPLLRPGEAEALAKKLAEGTPEDLQAKAEKLAELPAEVQQVLFDEIAPKLPPNARRVLNLAADLEADQTPAPPVGRGVPSRPEFDRKPQHEPPAVSREKILRDGRAALARGVDYLELRKRIAELGHDPNDFGPDVDTKRYPEVTIKPDSRGRTRIVGVGAGFEDDLGFFGEAGPNRLGGEDRFVPLEPENEFRDLEPEPVQTEPDSRSLLDTILDMFTGNSRREEDLEELPNEFFVLKENGEKKLSSIKVQLAFLVNSNDTLGQAAFVLEKFPSASVEFDKFGNVIAAFPNGQRFFVNRPGMSGQDSANMLKKLPSKAAGTVAGALAGGGVGGFAANKAVELGVDAISDIARQRRGTTEPIDNAIKRFDEEGGEGLESTEPQHRLLIAEFLSSPAFVNPETGRLTDEGGRVLNEAKIEPRLFTPAFIRKLKQAARSLEDSEVRLGGRLEPRPGPRAQMDRQSLREAKREKTRRRESRR